MSTSPSSLAPQNHQVRFEPKRAAPPYARPIWPALPVSILLISLVVPWVFSFGPLAVSSYRLVLLAITIPCIFSWASGKAGRIRAGDVLFGLYCFWCTIAMAAVHGPEGAIEPGGMLIIETFGAYIVARCYIRKLDDFVAAIRLLSLIVAIMLPLGAAELITGQKLTLEVFRGVLPTIVDAINEPRWGLTRVQGPFEHPILFGVFCAAPVVLAFLVLGGETNWPKRWALTATLALTSLMSLSSGPLVGLLTQLALLAWNGLLGGIAARWRIMWVLGTIVYTLAEVSTNQSVPQLLTSFAFDPWTAFYRLLIFDYGWASVMANPVFGTGFNDWVRPSWMSSSIDMFWLLPAIRHGLPAVILLFAAFFAVVFSVGFRPCLDQTLLACRTAYLITMAGFFLVGWTVHFWNATYVLFMFLLGSGVWVLDATEGAVAYPRGQQRNRTLARGERLKIRNTIEN